MNFHPATPEQECVVETSIDGENLTINAPAGSGKSDILRRIVFRRSDCNFIEFAFNRSTCEHAKATMPSWCKPYTFNGYAYRWLVRDRFAPLEAKLDRSIYIKAAASAIGSDERTAYAAKVTVDRFCRSADKIITGSHVPKQALSSEAQRVAAECERNDDPKIKARVNERAEEIVMAARRLWKIATAVGDKRIKITHDHVLKLFHLHGRNLETYDCQLIDEKQDMTPVNIEIARRMGCQTIAVGDAQQSLYGWRGCVDIDRFHDFYHRLHLTKSFRFGQVIADAANLVLSLLDEPPPKIVGAEWIESKLCYGPPTGRYAALARTNAGLLAELIASIDAGKSTHVIGDNAIRDATDQMESAWWLYQNKPKGVKHHTLKLFESWDALIELSEEDSDYRQIVSQVRRYGSEIPALCEKIRSAGQTPIDRADVVVSTVHGAKGMEFETVKLLEDFPPSLIRYSHDKKRYVALSAEVMVYYVAVTRAIKNLHINTTFNQLREWAQLIDRKS